MTKRWNWKAERRTLKEAIANNQFLGDWLADANAGREQFEQFALEADSAERQSCATRAGFRTWADLRRCQIDMHRAINHYVNHSTFHTLWEQLHEYEKAIDLPLELYGPHNGGVPRTLLRGIETWHQSPKFTTAELSTHKNKIIKKCDDLIALIEQVTPGNFGDKFASARLSEAEAEELFDRFATPKKRRQLYGPSAYFMARNAERLLTDSGITPLWFVKNIRDNAGFKDSGVLPTKVRAPSAFRTYLIDCVCMSVSMMTSYDNLPIADQLIADVVSLLSNMDCTADDVRKTMKARRTRDKNLSAEDSAEQME